MYICRLEVERCKRVAFEQYAGHASVDRDDAVEQRAFVCHDTEHTAAGLLCSFHDAKDFNFSLSSPHLSARQRSVEGCHQLSSSSFTCVADMLRRCWFRSLTFQPSVGQQSEVVLWVAGAKVWNGLPSNRTSASSLGVFKNSFKTYLFSHCLAPNDTLFRVIMFPPVQWSLQ